MKKQQKIVLAALLCLVMVMTVFAGCGKTEVPADTGDPDASAPVVVEPENISGTITMLTHRTDRLADGTFDALLAQFKEKYPGADVKFEGITDYAGELATRVQTKEYGDVLMIPDAVPATEYPRYFEPLGTVEELSGKYREEYLYSKWIDGKVYGLAYMSTVQGILYNKAVFAEAGITTLPKTPEEFLDALRLIKDNTDAIPYYTNANSGWPLNQWEDHCAGSVTGDPDYKNNKLALDKQAWAPGSSHYVVAKLLYDVIDQGLCEADPTTCDWEASKGMLNRGEIGCMVLGNWAISQMKEAGDTPENVGYMPFPVTVGGKQYATSATDYCYAINIHSENKDLARAWIDFLLDESGIAVREGGISLLKGDPMPGGLEDFEGVIFVVDNPATDENVGKLTEVEIESGLALYDESRMARIVDAARNISGETFDAIMADLNAKWAAAIDVVYGG
ncbi:MAG: extracellular solute-binding protein [Christensenellales bacterium]